MKKLTTSILVVVALISGYGCSSSENVQSGADAAADTATSTDNAGTTAGATSTAATDATTGTTSTQPLDSASFPVMAASSDMFEVLSSTTAQEKAVNADVKMFAQHMITDHTKTSTEMKAMAGRKNIMLPAAPLAMHQRRIQALSTEDAKDFDKAYMTAQVVAHREAVSLFESAANTNPDPELKAFAQKTLPALKMHLDMAQKTRDKVK